MPEADDNRPVMNLDLVAPLEMVDLGAALDPISSGSGSEADSESEDLLEEGGGFQGMILVAGGGFFVLGVLGIWIYFRR